MCMHTCAHMYIEVHAHTHLCTHTSVDVHMHTHILDFSPPKCLVRSSSRLLKGLVLWAPGRGGGALCEQWHCPRTVPGCSHVQRREGSPCDAHGSAVRPELVAQLLLRMVLPTQLQRALCQALPAAEVRTLSKSWHWGMGQRPSSTPIPFP